MKRLLLPAALVACAAACAPAPSNTANTNANMSNMNMSNMNMSSANASNANSASNGSYSDDDIIAKEREVYDAIKKKDANAFGALLADDFTYFGTDAAAHNKADTIKIATSDESLDVSLSDFKLVRIDRDAAVLIYDDESKGTDSHGKSFDMKERDSSVWVNRGGKWVAIFHEDGPILPPPAAGGANANANANSNANSANSNKPATAASPAAATADAEADEKAVWDAIKRGDSAGFGSYLADDAIEAEPDGVYTKSQSISSIANYSFLKTAQLSDFKTQKIDDDATIVMYTVKGTGPDHKPFTDHHATVWANRGGTWKAVFHHGTPVGPRPSASPSANANK